MPDDTTLTDSPRRRPARALPILAIGIAAVAGTLTLGDVLSFETLAARRDELLALRAAYPLATAAGFVLAYAAIVALSLPGAAVASLTGGFLFGTLLGTPLNVLAATAGAVAIFAAARAGFGARLAARMDAAEGRVKRLKAAIDANQWEALFVMRLVPVVPFFVANLLPAIFGVPLHRFLVTTAIGILPGALVFTSLGAGLGAIFDAGAAPDLGVIFAPHILWPLLGLAALAALPAVLRALRRRGA
jgi:uncharacterized membrane protein YdjX (TVP38/TMEM64 family)